MTWLLLSGAIATEVAATLSLRASEGFTRRRWITPVVLGYATAFALLAVLLAGGAHVGVVYGIWVSVGVALTAVFGKLLFGDPLNRTMLAGVALIGAGVFLVETGL